MFYRKRWERLQAGGVFEGSEIDRQYLFDFYQGYYWSIQMIGINCLWRNLGERSMHWLMKADPQKNDLEHYTRIHAFFVKLCTKARRQIIILQGGLIRNPTHKVA